MNIHVTSRVTDKTSTSTLSFLQEHWLSDGQLCKLGDIDDSFFVCSCFRLHKLRCINLLSGRPFAPLHHLCFFILWVGILSVLFIDDDSFSNLDYADDVALLAEMLEVLILSREIMQEEA